MKLSDAPWIIPLLQAVERGETLQFFNGLGWADAVGRLSFAGSAENYRIKPKPHQFRLYKYTRATFVNLYVVERNSPSDNDQYYEYVARLVQDGKAAWVGDWTDVPQN